MNVTVVAKLASTTWTKALDEGTVPVPLTNGGPSERLSFAARLTRNEIENLVAAHRRDGKLTLAIVATAESLEGVRWATSVTYVLQFRAQDAQMIEALMADDAVSAERWAQQATVEANHSVKPGTWKYRQI